MSPPMHVELTNLGCMYRTEGHETKQVDIVSGHPRIPIWHHVTTKWLPVDTQLS